jgi:hypothetical protein
MPVTSRAGPETPGNTPAAFAVTLKYCIGWEVDFWWLYVSAPQPDLKRPPT